MLLTRRQFVILRRIAKGLSHEKIAAELAVAPRTIRAHMETIYKKLHLQEDGRVNAVKAGVWWSENGSCETWDDYLRQAVPKGRRNETLKEVRLWPVEERNRVGQICDDAVFRRGELTRRQFEIIVRLAAGKEYKEFADELHITVRTVKWHMVEFYDNHPELERSQVRAIQWWGANGACKTWEEYIQFEAAKRAKKGDKTKIVLIRNAEEASGGS